MSKYFGDKAFTKKVLYIAIPIMIQQLISGSVQLIDNLMVGTLGDFALGGVGAANRFYMIVQFGMLGLSAAGTVFIAQYHGADNQKRMKESFRFVLVSLIMIAVFFLIIGLLIPQPIIHFFTSVPETMRLGISYLSISVFTFVPVAISMTISGSLRAIGNVKTPLYISSIAVITNTILNFCLIFGNFGFPALGVQGAAIATLIARVIEMVLFLIVLKRENYPFKSKIQDIFQIPKVIRSKILTKAIPLVANEVGWSAGMATLFMLYSKGGSDIMAGYLVASTVSDLFFVLFGGMATASTVLIAQPLGANKLDEGRRNGYQLIGFSMMMSLFFASCMFLFSFAIPYLYTDISSGAVEFAGLMMKIQSIMFIFYMISTQNYFILRAGGDTISTFIFDSCFMWLINIPLVWGLTIFTDLPVYIIFICGQSVEFLKIALGTYLVRKEKWVHNLAHEEE
ncbi:MAG: MATE family efflux transporter [Anaerorhabdus sp.]